MTHKEFPLSAHPTSIRQARAHTSSTLSDAGCTDDGAVALVVPELVTNAIVHAGEPIALHLWPRRGHVRVGVSDASTMPPTQTEPLPGRRHGRGLRLVERLALRWGFDPHPSGKLTWAEMECG